jgi:hypothetical protein
MSVHDTLPPLPEYFPFIKGIDSTEEERAKAYATAYAKLVLDSVRPGWVVRFYVGMEWPTIKGYGIELECAGATREQAEAIAKILNSSGWKK